MGFFNNVGVTPPTKDNIYSLFNIPNVNDHKFGRIRKKKTSTGLRIFIDNDTRNAKGSTYISESNDYDTEEIVKFLIENHLCVEDIQSISLFFTIELKYYKKVPYKYRLNGELLSRIYGPKDVLAEILLKNNSSLSLSMRRLIRMKPIEV